MYLKVTIMRKYSIAEISEKTGLSRRTIRYYLQRGLVPSPLGAGRGRFYTEDHLDQIRKIIELQSKGMFLDEIARHLAPGDGIEPVLSEKLSDSTKMKPPKTISHKTYEAKLPVHHLDPGEPTRVGYAAPVRETWIKIPIEDGVELSVREDLSVLVDEHLQQIADTIGRIIRQSRTEGQSTNKEKGDNNEK